MRFVPYDLTATIPNVIVDGAANERTILTLSHWPKSGTPPALKADTSTEIVFNYLEAPSFHVDADVVSNNHFDEDGLIGIFALLRPEAAQRHRDLLIDAAQAGDFGVFRQRQAARIAFVLAAYADAELSPLPADVFARPYADVAGELYVQVLEVLPALLTNVDDYRKLWEREDARLTATESLIEAGGITIEERPGLDLAIVRIAEPAEPHPFALHSRTASSRLLLVQGHRVELQYRYEGWVQLASRRTAARVDLAPLARELNGDETAGARWAFDRVDQITPRLRLDGNGVTSIPVAQVVSRIERHLKEDQPAWDPYD
jgi:hypothetical protein